MMNSLLHMPALWAIIFGLSAISLVILLLALPKSQSVPKLFFIAFPILFLGATIALYHYWGAANGLVEKQALEILKNEIADITKDPNIAKDEAIAKFTQLEKKIAYSPYALTQMGSVYNQLGLFDQALCSLNNAIELSPNDIEIQEQWVYTHSLKNQGKLTSEVRKKAQEIVQGHPHRYGLLNLLAIDDYFQGNYAQAVKEWELLLASDKELVLERKQVIESALVKAKSFLPQEQSQGPKLAVKVRLSTQLLSQVLGNETVFVFVKQSGNPMPLAVVRRSVAECPFTVDFDSKHSMIAGFALTAGMKVEVVAKLSKTGDPLDKSSELRASTKQFILKSVNQPIEVEIN